MLHTAIRPRRGLTPLSAGLVVLLAAFVAIPIDARASTDTGCAPGQTARYVFGFAELNRFIGRAMGDPSTCEFADPGGTGDVHQSTSNGLAFWRKTTNTPTFTDGFNHWGHTPQGWAYWTGSSIDPAPNAHVFPDDVVQALLEGRSGGNASAEGYSRCLTNRLLVRYTLAELLDVVASIKDAVQFPPKLASLAGECSSAVLRSYDPSASVGPTEPLTAPAAPAAQAAQAALAAPAPASPAAPAAPSPSPTPTAVPTPAPSQPQLIVQGLNWVRGTDLYKDRVWVLGEVRNTGSPPAFDVSVAACWPPTAQSPVQVPPRFTTSPPVNPRAS